ncbi:phosphoethanolamine n-methyltransferase 3 [Podospora australis]|uniref:Phosphoethanolamine n-methyltransferase 3 n=1 Tax=Podospora australis TaxID=1536484 RepID=A0AAN7AHC9_9PEZI|nr:phosphoethanolamine n-methyltransferase 3 [Podospora australis]
MDRTEEQGPTAISIEHRSPPTPDFEEVDDNNDSGFDSRPGSTTSLPRNILQRREVNGERCHTACDGAFSVGCDIQKQSRAQELNHHLYTLTLDDKLYLAPLETIQSLQKVLDAGCGTGLWAIDFADEHPEARVIGIDISPIQPSWVPPNLEFQIDNLTRPWTFSTAYLDYIHIRHLTGSITDWNVLFSEAFRCLRPGGILESHEPSCFLYTQSDSPLDESSDATSLYQNLAEEAGTKFGRPFTVVEDNLQENAMMAADFVDIHVHRRKVPVGAWPLDPREKEMGIIAKWAFEEALACRILHAGTLLDGWSDREAERLAAQLRQLLSNMTKHYWTWHKIVWGRKPLR